MSLLWQMDLDVQAASGLVKLDDTLYVISDDELSLAILSFSKKKLINFLPLVSGQLPIDHKERKKLKPDWESLVYIPETESCEGLLTLPSGSKPNRNLGSFIAMKDQQLRKPQNVDTTLLFEKLQLEFAELNIEGAAIQAGALKILQRGNGQLGQNAVIDLDLKGVLDDIQQNRPLQPQRIKNITAVDLGLLQQHRLGFTDACVTATGQLYYLAVSEATNSTYDDGQFLGAVLGQLSPEGKITWQIQLDCPYKPEGLWIEQLGKNYQVFVVTDADNPEQISSLYSGEIPG